MLQICINDLIQELNTEQSMKKRQQEAGNGLSIRKRSILMQDIIPNTVNKKCLHIRMTL